jgi:hypothetical protein
LLVVLNKTLQNYALASSLIALRDSARPNSGDISQDTEQESTEAQELISIRLDKSHHHNSLPAFVDIGRIALDRGLKLSELIE